MISNVAGLRKFKLASAQTILIFRLKVPNQVYHARKFKLPQIKVAGVD